MVRAKFKCVEKKSMMYYMAEKPSAVVKLMAVTDERNKEWAKHTPAGTIEMTIDNPDAYNAFELGKEYLVDFQIAESTS